ncbi:MAG: hypothetical protein CMJ78_22040, partial [Planctomycetaceae bacterium]|nr:hypothetical protein [Planctomycetaceae bacterium]
MNRYIILFIALCAQAVFCSTARAEEPKFDAAQLEFFEKKIRPVLVEHCYKCHGGDAKSVKGNLRLDTRAATLKGGDSGPAVVPSKPDESLILSAIKYEDFEMPPKGKLPKNIIADFETWIRSGAADPRSGKSTPTNAGINYEAGSKFWAFQKPVKPKIPTPKDGKWSANDIDRFVRAKLEAAGLSPADAAERDTLIRRTYFGLIGLPPSTEQIDAFVQDTSPSAFDKVIDELLDSPHYGERWGRHWLDVARYGEDQAHTFKARKYPRGYYYRDWVVRSLNNDLPYNEFLKAQVAGDLIKAPNQHENIAALGLFALGPVYYAENVEKAKAAADEWDDRIDTLTRGVLGLTVSCARCHDHKYDPISMQDYYGLAGIFASTQYKERPIVSNEIVGKRREADDLASQQQVIIDRFLIDESRKLRTSLFSEIPKYFVAAWKVTHRQRSSKDAKKVFADFAKAEKLNQQLLKRWINFQKPRKDDATARPYLKEWFELQKSQDGKSDLSGDEAAVVKVAESLRGLAESKVERKDDLFAQYGADVAFVNAADKVEVVPGIIPLGNLFDDSQNASLDIALSTDRFGQAASANSLAVDRVANGWGKSTNIAPDVVFSFDKLGSDTRAYGSIVNDAWQTGGALRTTGRRGQSNKRVEQGIGMHANALITFDLDKIRRAGLMPADQRFTFKVDRAGINDEAIGSNASAHLAVIVSKPHRDKNISDAIIAAYVNGQKMELATNDFEYYFAGEIPKPLLGNGKYCSFNLAIPSDAKHLTLVATGAGMGSDGNTINSDHTVFSGVRLEMNPLPEAPKVAGKKKTPQESKNELNHV